MGERDKLRSEAKSTNSDETWKKYRKLHNKVTKEVAADRKKFFKDKYDECEVNNDQAKLYKVAKSQLGWNVSGPPSMLVDKDGNMLNSPQQLVNEQMEYLKKKTMISWKTYRIHLMWIRLKFSKNV